MGPSGEMAVVRFAAFAAGVSVGEVSMVGGVHVLAGAKRTGDVEDERVVRQRGERGERWQRREQRRAVEAEQEQRRGRRRTRSDAARGANGIT